MSDRDLKFFLSLDCDGLGAQAQVWRGDADGTRTLLACVGHETRDGGSIGSGFDPFAEGEPFEIPLAPVEPPVLTREKLDEFIKNLRDEGFKATEEGWDSQRAELVQVAAVTLAMIACGDRAHTDKEARGE